MSSSIPNVLDTIWNALPHIQKDDITQNLFDSLSLEPPPHITSGLQHPSQSFYNSQRQNKIGDISMSIYYCSGPDLCNILEIADSDYVLCVDQNTPYVNDFKRSLQKRSDNHIFSNQKFIEAMSLRKKTGYYQSMDMKRFDISNMIIWELISLGIKKSSIDFSYNDLGLVLSFPRHQTTRTFQYIQTPISLYGPHRELILRALYSIGRDIEFALFKAGCMRANRIDPFLLEIISEGGSLLYDYMDFKAIRGEPFDWQTLKLHDSIEEIFSHLPTYGLGLKGWRK